MSVAAQSSPACAGRCPAGDLRRGNRESTGVRARRLLPRGSPAARPCSDGRHGNCSGLRAADESFPAPVRRSIGATKAVACTPGTVATNSSSGACTSCAEGSYQGDEGQTACITCGDGYRCPKGSIVPVPATCAEEPTSTSHSTCASAAPTAAGARGASQPRNCCAAATGRQRVRADLVLCWNLPGREGRDELRHLHALLVLQRWQLGAHAVRRWHGRPQ